MPRAHLRTALLPLLLALVTGGLLLALGGNETHALGNGLHRGVDRGMDRGAGWNVERVPSQPAGSLEERAFATNVTSTFAIPLTADRTNTAGISEAAANGQIFWLGSPYGGNKARGLTISYFGVGADGAQGTCKVWLVYQGGAGSSPDTDTLRRAYYGTAVFTLSSGVTGLAGSDVADATQYFADTLTWALSSTGTSPKGPGSAIETAFGSPGSAAYSPGDDLDQAVLFLPDLGNADGILLELDKGTATSVNATITRITN